ncbi:MAG: hypothetical protein ACXVIY_03115 [Mucilaginibacter sp.]
MTKTIEAALAEREMLQREFDSLKAALVEDMFIREGKETPLEEIERRRISLRLRGIKVNIKYLDSLIINDLLDKPNVFTVPTEV